MGVNEIFGLIGGLCLFLFGMNIMGEALERKAGGALRSILGRLTSNKAMGFLTGLGVTAIIQSSSATTVMVVGFVNSGLMSLRQSIMVIMGANIGTTVTAWMLSLIGIEGGNIITELLKPSCFAPILALIGVVFYMFLKNDKKKETGLILLGFSTLMFGMETMSAAVAGLQDMPGFRELFLLFSNPLLGALAGMLLTVVIQSSSASTGITQALAATGQVTYGSAIPLIIGQNVGTCATALISCVGASRDAKRTAMVHLLFNVLGAAVWLTVYCVMQSVFRPAVLGQAATAAGIAVVHTVFNLLCTLLLLPLSGLLEKLVVLLVPDGKADKEKAAAELDERLFAFPSIALQRSHDVTCDMAISVSLRVREAMAAIDDPETAGPMQESAKATEGRKNEIDKYLIRLSTLPLDRAAGGEVAMLLKITGELRYISRQSMEIADCARRLRQDDLQLSPAAREEFKTICAAMKELIRLSMSAVTGSDPSAAEAASALAQVIHACKRDCCARHVSRLRQHICSAETGFVWVDLLTALERIADHYANICSHIIEERGAAGETPQSVCRAFEERFRLPSEN
ncbi:MAG: Na/Pi cotransporter family protein [Eubacteriales bacterium]|nr:Na/Pi cotransporter family protein [Eubacteriales bacterium]